MIDARRLILVHAFEAALDLRLHDLERRARLALRERFAHAENRAQLVLQRGEDLLVHELVGLAEERAALAVAEDDVRRENRAQHRRGDLAGERAAGFEVHVLRAELHVRAFERLAHATRAR